MGSINFDLAKIKAILFDVDGVLSASTIPMSEEGLPQRTLNIKDGYAIHIAIKKGILLGIISGGKSDAVKRRYVSLGMDPENIYMQAAVKIDSYEHFKERHQLKDEEIIFVGDDIPDLEVMKLCGLACCPKDAAHEVKSIAKYISNFDGGYGVARDILEQYLKVKSMWLDDDEAFGW